MLKEINISDLKFNPFDKIAKDWYLVTAGDILDYNTMTASWGSMGIFWGEPVINCYIRPQRYTHEFIEKNDLFTVSFFDDGYKKVLNFCGTNSGRDVNKAQKTGLTPIALDGTTSFEQASLVFVCKKLYSNVIDPSRFIDGSINKKWYADKDYHECYCAKILKVYSK